MMNEEERNDKTVKPENSEQTPAQSTPAPGADSSRRVEVLQTQLRQAYRRRATFHLGRGLGWLVLCLVGLIFVDLAVLKMVRLPGLLRFVLLLANLAALGWIAVQLIVPHLRRFDALRTALQVEKAEPEATSLLVSAVQFRRGQMTPRYSGEVLAMVEGEAVDRLERIDPKGIADFRRIRAVLAGGAAALLLLVVVTFVWPGEMSALARLMLNPFSQATFPTVVQIEDVTGDAEIRQNTGLTLEAIARINREKQPAATTAEPAGNEAAANGPGTASEGEQNDLPDTAVLWINMGNEWESIGIEREGEGQFSYVFPQVYRGFDYYFEIGDATSPHYTVTVVEPPRVRRAVVRLKYPDYMNVDLPGEVRTLNVKVPEATMVNWELAMDGEVSNPVLNIEGRKPLKPAESESARVDGEPGTILRFRAPASASASYALEYDWTMNGEEFHERGPRHFLRVIPDNAPSVALTYPARDLKATLEKDMVLEFRASDDYGLQKAWLVYALNEQQERRKPLDEIENGRTVTREIQWNIREDLPDLREGDIVTFSVEVNDGRPDADAALGRSRSRRVQFVSHADYMAYLQAQQRKFLGRIRPLYRHELEATGKMQDLMQTDEPDTTEEGR
jgi:hypothetical protein